MGDGLKTVARLCGGITVSNRHIIVKYNKNGNRIYKGEYKMKDETKKWNDYVIDAEGDPNPDGSGEVDMVEQGFACPDCGTLLPPLSDQGIAGCSNCMSIWQRLGDELVGVDEDDVVSALGDNL